jgi:hypothetical protein
MVRECEDDVVRKRYKIRRGVEGNSSLFRIDAHYINMSKTGIPYEMERREMGVSHANTKRKAEKIAFNRLIREGLHACIR